MIINIHIKPKTRLPDEHPGVHHLERASPWRCNVYNTYINVISALETALQAQLYFSLGVEYIPVWLATYTVWRQRHFANSLYSAWYEMCDAASLDSIWSRSDVSLKYKYTTAVVISSPYVTMATTPTISIVPGRRAGSTNVVINGYQYTNDKKRGDWTYMKCALASQEDKTRVVLVNRGLVSPVADHPTHIVQFF